VLQLRENGILSTGAIALANALIQRQVNTPRTLPSSLDELDLSCNKIGDSGAEAFSAVLRLDCALRILDVSYNSITVAGARQLSRAAEGHRTLERLLVRAVARSHGEQSELAALQLRHREGYHRWVRPRSFTEPCPDIIEYKTHLISDFPANLRLTVPLVSLQSSWKAHFVSLACFKFWCAHDFSRPSKSSPNYSPYIRRPLISHPVFLRAAASFYIFHLCGIRSRNAAMPAEVPPTPVRPRPPGRPA
jgi:hypothetical protein